MEQTRSLQRHAHPVWSAREGARGPWGQLAVGRLSSTALRTMPAQGRAWMSCPRAPGWKLQDSGVWKSLPGSAPWPPRRAVCVWGEGIGVKPGVQDLRSVTRGLRWILVPVIS